MPICGPWSMTTAWPWPSSIRPGGGRRAPPTSGSRPSSIPSTSFVTTRDELLRIADVFGARSINAVDVLGGRWDIEEGAAAFGALCDRAADHGLVVHLEWLAWSRIPDLATALEIVRLADRANGGLNIDTWHCARTGTTAAQLSALPGDRVLAQQISDGPLAAEADLLDATLHHRLLPGQGDFDLAGYLGALRRAGAEAPVGVEVFSDALHALGPARAARQAAEATRRLLAVVDGQAVDDAVVP